MIWITLATSICCLIMTGIFFAFSSFVMPALNQLTPSESIRAMQRINIDVFHWSFKLVFFGAPLLCLVLGISSSLNWQDNRSVTNTIGAIIYLIASFLVTGLGNVPLNNELQKVDPMLDPRTSWANYYGPWVRWNHLRTAASGIAGILFIYGLHQPL